jgi:phenylalanyl-tRNA synthetase beta chain
MKVPISWLEEYVPVTLPLEDIAHRLTMAGTEVVSVDTTLSFDGVVVGLAKKVGPHPNADRSCAALQMWRRARRLRLQVSVRS